MKMYPPSAVDLAGSFPPLAGTMHKSEAEAAATLVLRTCQLRGDKWQPITTLDMADTIEADLSGQVEPLHSLNTNPFWKPDFFQLVDRGYARWTDPQKVTDDGSSSPVEFTDTGLAVMLRYADPGQVLDVPDDDGEDGSSGAPSRV